MNSAPENARLRALLHRAHDMLTAVVRDDFADVSDIIDDIRVALDLHVTDCDHCRACIPELDASEYQGETLCPDCAALSIH